MLLAKIVLSAILGGIIGFEREVADKPAGLRTHMIVGASATLLVGLGTSIALSFPDDSLIRSDPIRIIEAIIVGISFLGAGTIFKQRDEEGVAGLTTAASILFTAGIGIAVALDHYILAGGVTVLGVLITYVLGRIEPRIKNMKGS
ncbi:MAG: MgtC/SapB family protein [Chloroflexi bacterium]|nr:MAG: MgtC/SapB family protein [Chloroflexota bacterium]